MGISGIKIIGIMAVDPKGVIGDGGKLPWNYPDDRAWFRKMILGQVVIMGRKTFESMPNRLLSECTPIVFSRSDEKLEGCTVVRSLEELFHLISVIPSEHSRSEGESRDPDKVYSGSLDSHFTSPKLREMVARDDGNYYLIGGAEVAHLFLQHGLIDEFFLTRVHASYPGDTRLNLDLFKGWREEVLKQTPEYKVCKLTPTPSRHPDRHLSRTNGARKMEWRDPE